MKNLDPKITRYIFDKYVFLDKVDSTNEYCKSPLVRCDRIVRAAKQTKGRGRMGRCFSSEDGGFYISYCFFPKELKPEALMPLTGLCAVAVSEALFCVTGIMPDIKWPNDLLLGGKKVCGILVENVIGSGGSVERLIIGIGINTNQSADCFCGELGGIAGSFLSLTGKRVDEDELLTELSVRIFGVYNCILNGDRERMNIIAEKYREHCITLGRTVHILRPELAPNGMDPKKLFSEEPNRFPSAIALDIDENFALIVRYPDGHEEKISSGEVSVAL